MRSPLATTAYNLTWFLLFNPLNNTKRSCYYDLHFVPLCSFSFSLWLYSFAFQPSMEALFVLSENF